MTEPKFRKESSFRKHFWDDAFKKADQQLKESLQRWRVAFDAALVKTRSEPNRLFEYSELFPCTTPSGFYTAFIVKTGRSVAFTNLYASILKTHSFECLNGKYHFVPNSLKAEITTKQAETARLTKEKKKEMLHTLVIQDLFSKLQVGGRVHWIQIRQLYNDKEINGSKVVMHEPTSKKLLEDLANQGYLDRIKVDQETWYKRIK